MTPAGPWLPTWAPHGSHKMALLSVASGASVCRSSGWTRACPCAWVCARGRVWVCAQQGPPSLCERGARGYSRPRAGHVEPPGPEWVPVESRRPVDVDLTRRDTCEGRLGDGLTPSESREPVGQGGWGAAGTGCPGGASSFRSVQGRPFWWQLGAPLALRACDSKVLERGRRRGSSCPWRQGPRPSPGKASLDGGDVLWGLP